MDVKAEIERLRAMKLEELVTRYVEEYGRRPRVSHSKEWLWKRLCWRYQERIFGGLSTAAKRRLEEIIATIEVPPEEDRRNIAGALRQKPAPGMPSPGTILRRAWKGQVIEVHVREDGFEWNGKSFKSLSSLAFAITGSKWNGKLFFNLVGRKRKAT